MELDCLCEPMKNYNPYQSNLCFLNDIPDRIKIHRNIYNLNFCCFEYRAIAAEVVDGFQKSRCDGCPILNTSNQYNISKDDIDAVVVLYLCFLQNLGLVTNILVPKKACGLMKVFTNKICTLYAPKNPYHNVLHGLEVSQFMMCLLQELLIIDSSALSDIDCLIVLISSLCHDVCHDGMTNSFHCLVGTAIAVRYEGQSVLENLHASTTLQVLKKTGLSSVLFPDKDSFFYAKNLIVQLILTTDMSLSKITIDEFICGCQEAKSINNGYKDSRGALVKDLPGGVKSLLKMYIKLADLSHFFRNFNEHSLWVKRIHEEFWKQGELERAMGLEENNLFSRKFRYSIPHNQAEVIQRIIEPILNPLSDFLGEKHCAIYRKRLFSVRKKWIKYSSQYDCTKVETWWHHLKHCQEILLNRKCVSEELL
eukprot:GHVL01006174.1.p1 GENE.GHVL01006174.1~~GHVL01006174.1.p1  ORF type:complete len:423 (-),score=23.44 GHVL01006174.1:89-1357(-)